MFSCHRSQQLQRRAPDFNFASLHSAASLVLVDGEWGGSVRGMHPLGTEWWSEHQATCPSPPAWLPEQDLGDPFLPFTRVTRQDR